MRLWHKDLISVLPEMQLKWQWRECCLIAKALLENNLNHVLVNRVKDYPTEHFFQYCGMVFREMQKRGYKVDKNRLLQYAILYEVQAFENEPIEYDNLFDCYVKGKFIRWHYSRYLKQCLCNLEEKAMCGGIPPKEWEKVVEKFGEYFDLWRG